MQVTFGVFIVRSLIFVVLAFFALIAVLPLVYMLVSSMKTSTEFFVNPLGVPSVWNFENYRALFIRFDLVRLYGNTIICALGALLLTLLLSVPASYAFAKLRFRFRSALFIGMIATMTIPGITFIIPNYLIMSKLGLIDSYLSVILMWGVISVPGNSFLLTSLMRGLPDETLEAVKMDGANYFQLMFLIVLPLSIPGIVTVSIFCLTGWWNDLLTPLLYLQTDSMKTLTVATATILGRFGDDFPLLLSGLVLVSVPPVLLYVFLQGYIRKGLVVGAVK
ncbi:carbohydrate ABC transporter permease (plasmid) [Paenibacillus rhizovicinus]|uniref:Carbohydrate ABC transporter permease n=1 Tax=Paenibacillus rhizovicinus TaxID=2704463 RepID=A0A6C0PAH4_9BACL|nr:carbohydrate ABC transporter permease [Paenibacillus rhizovicinus]QHW35528.1 carbohydrate ABC transporter permease [Paenibacillus rhizovicinus]